MLTLAPTVPHRSPTVRCPPLLSLHFARKALCVESFTAVYFTPSFISSACIFREVQADENSAVPTAPAPAAARDTLCILRFQQSERQNHMWEAAFIENHSKCLRCHQLRDS